MGMLRICAHPGCTTRTLGEYCLQHETLQAAPLTPPREAPAPAAKTPRP
jgi:hypothetical protein